MKATEIVIGADRSLSMSSDEMEAVTIAVPVDCTSLWAKCFGIALVVGGAVGVTAGFMLLL